MIAIAKSARDFAMLRGLLVEYENSLPGDLRHRHEQIELAAERYSFPNVAFLALRDGDAAGCVALEKVDGDTASVRHLYVRPAARGGGVARALMDALLALARERGYARVILDTHRERLGAAYRLYLSLGFKECEPLHAVDYACPTYMELRF